MRKNPIILNLTALGIICVGLGEIGVSDCDGTK